MKGYLLDTSLISEILKKRPSSQVMGRLRAVPAWQLLTTSTVCVMELRFGAVRHPDGEPLWQRIRREVLDRISILPLGLKEAVKAGEVLAALQAAGTPIGVEDVLIGATALAHDLTVATRNLKHFSRLPGLLTEDWWA
ncbi:MAG: PIN domain-containing protein [Acidobacteriota bacterium]